MDHWIFFTFYMIKQETHIYLIHYTMCQQSCLHGNFHIHVFMNQQVYSAFLRYTKRIYMKMNRKKKWWWYKCKRFFTYKYVFMWHFLWLIVRNWTAEMNLGSCIFLKMTQELHSFTFMVHIYSRGNCSNSSWYQPKLPWNCLLQCWETLKTSWNGIIT